MAEDWVDDGSLSREETLARFRALGPQPTKGPDGSERGAPRRVSGDDSGFVIVHNRTESTQGIRTAAR